jgi:enoyl-CoA hydratase/carnithine racemase
MTSTGQIDHARDAREAGSVHTITVANPDKLNILDSTAMDEMDATLARVAEDRDARVVVLRGKGQRAWIGGADIREMALLDEHSALAFIGRLHGVCQQIRELPVPVVAAIRGWCLGAGLEVAACCDLRLAAAGSRFGMPEVRVGLPSVIEAAVLPRIIGIGRARDLVMTGRIVDADEAWHWGLLDGLVPDADLDALVERRTGEILAGAPGAMRQQKALCRAWEEQPLTSAIATGIEAFGAAFRGDEPRRYLQRFLARTGDEKS